MASQSKRDSPTFFEPAGIDNSAETGRVLLDRYSLNSYTLVRVSSFEHCLQTLDKLVSLDKILNIKKLQDESWELAVHKLYLLRLKDELRKLVPNCIADQAMIRLNPTQKRWKNSVMRGRRF